MKTSFFRKVASIFFDDPDIEQKIIYKFGLSLARSLQNHWQNIDFKDVLIFISVSILLVLMIFYFKSKFK